MNPELDVQGSNQEGGGAAFLPGAASPGVMAHNLSPPVPGIPVLQDTHRLQAIVESSDDAIVSKDLNGIITTWNKAAESIFGYSAVEAIGRSVTMLMPHGKEDEEAEILRRIRQGIRVGHYETVRRRKDGALIDVSLTVSPIKDAHNRVVGASKIARDVTLRKRMDAELRAAKDELARLNQELEKRVEERTASLAEAVAQLDAFSHTVSHDLRSPVRAMKVYAQLVLAEYSKKLEPEANEYLEQIVQSSSRMDQLIQDLLACSRVTHRELKLAPVNLNNLLPAIIREHPELRLSHACIRICAPLLPVLGHELLLSQAISNLLTNAVKFVKPKTVPEVVVRTEKRDHLVRCWVEDKGIGIKPEHQERVFGIFERLHKDGQFDGTGVGLSIVRKAVERMGGQISVESDGASGTRFWIDLAAVPEDRPGESGR